MGVMKIPDEVMQRVCRQWNDTSSACSGGEIRVDSGSEHTYPEKSCGYHMWGASRDGAKCGHLKPYDEGDAHLYTTLADDATSCCQPNDSGDLLPEWMRKCTEWTKENDSEGGWGKYNDGTGVLKIPDEVMQRV